MSYYEHNKVIRCKVSPKDLCVSDLYELSETYPDLFDIGIKVNFFTIAPTTETFIDYTLYHEDSSGEYGFCRKLTQKELDLYIPIFKKIIPFVSEDMLRYVDYCWYNCSEAPDYFKTEEEIEEENYKKFHTTKQEIASRSNILTENDIFTIPEFISMFIDGSIRSCDGVGYFHDGEKEIRDFTVWDTTISWDAIKKFPYICWYNK